MGTCPTCWLDAFLCSEWRIRRIDGFFVSQCHIDLDIGEAFCFLLFTLGFIARDNWDNYRALG
jgi:hypothetical protein